MNALSPLGMVSELPSSNQTTTNELPGQAPEAQPEEQKDYFVEKDGVKFAGTHLLIDLWGATNLGDPDLIDRALRVAAELRLSGLRVLVYPDAEKIGKQIKYADGRGIPLVAILGADEIAAGTVTVKNNYFRIEGPRVWIEISVQRGVIFSSDIHYHGIWRDKSGDYGGKCLG